MWRQQVLRRLSMNMIATRKLSVGMVTLALCAIMIGAAVVPQAAQAAQAIRISQVYGGGGGSGFYLFDYVELFNNSNLPVTVPSPGWTLQYGSATGTSFGSTAGNIATIPAGTVLPACGYFLIQLGAAGTAGSALPVTPDLISTTPNGISISATSGKIALMDYLTGGNGCTAIPPNTAGNTVGGNPHIIDAIGWGPTANCFETAVASVLTNAQANVRAGAGTQDSDSNAADFAVVTSPVPRNSASPSPTACTDGTPASKSTWGRLKSIYR
jgi:hypothetical protein